MIQDSLVKLWTPQKENSGKTPPGISGTSHSHEAQVKDQLNLKGLC